MTHGLLSTTTRDFRERYGVLLDIGRILTGTLEPADLYRTIYEQASRVLETTGFFISLYDEEEDRATIVFSADRGCLERPGVTYRGSESRAIREASAVSEELTHPSRAIMVLGPESDEEITRSVIAAPMLREGRVLGVISAQSYRASAFDRDDLELLDAIARLAAVAVSNARTMEELERQRRESQQLEEIGRALTSSLELDEVLQRIIAAIRDVSNADGAGVWLVRRDGDAELVMGAGEAALPVGTTLRINDPLQRRFRVHRDPLVIHAAAPPDDVPADLLEALRGQSAIAVPLIAEDELIGALSVSHLEPRRYPQHVVRLLQRFAFHAAIAVSNARLHDKVRTLSLTDPLTRLPNRRQMEMVLDREFAAAERGRPLAVVMFDLNDFKAYNDTAGHQAGDDVLRRFGEILATETRAMNLAARYGGDEFICILSDTADEGGVSQIERVTRAVARDALMGDITVSAGIASYEPGMGSARELIRKADEALYRTKWARSGR
ncbi:MAG: sensor domain-containing diguanylate cyclase [Gemmatimonadota bacterium]|jgi:diguanylate cyclase (GGDEF)-like protein